MLGIMHARILASLRIVSNRICVHPVSRTLVVRGPEIVQPIEFFFFFPRNQIFLLLSIHSISSIIVVSNNTPTHRSIRYREIDRCRNSGNTVISVIGRAYRTRLFIYIYIRISTRYRPPPRFLDRSARFVFFARARRTIN